MLEVLEELEVNIAYYGFSNAFYLIPEEFEISKMPLFEKYIKKYQKDKNHFLHMHAWLAHVVKATDKKGNFIYKKFEDFLNHNTRSNLSAQELRKIQQISKNI